MDELRVDGHGDGDGVGQAGIEHVRQSPRADGTVELIVCRPAPGERLVVERAELDLTVGLVGDNWLERGSRRTSDGRARPDHQVTVMNARAAQLVAGDRDRWGLAGDQLYVDLHLGADSLPPGSELHVGSAVLEVTAAPHRGCAKFTRHFGEDATRLVNSPDGVAMNLRGVNARVVRPGTVRTGDAVRAVHPSGLDAAEAVADRGEPVE